MKREKWWQQVRFENKILTYTQTDKGKQRDRQTQTHTNTLSLTHTHTRTHSLTHTHNISLSLSLSYTHTISLSFTHTHTLSLSNPPTHPPTHPHPHTHTIERVVLKRKSNIRLFTWLCGSQSELCRLSSCDFYFSSFQFRSGIRFHFELISVSEWILKKLS